MNAMIELKILAAETRAERRKADLAAQESHALKNEVMMNEERAMGAKRVNGHQPGQLFVIQMSINV